MTAKRFKHSEIIQDDGQTICYGIEDTQTRHIFNVIGDGIYDVSEKELVKLLNELHEENEVLKHQLQQQELEYATTCNRLAEENEQLQEQRAELFIRERDTKNEWREIKQENESLKEENKFLRNKVATYKKGNALLKSTMDKEWK